MEDLSKAQIILLALLISFVGSVATSIITYSLLVEAPPVVTQTVNRVVERTIETVVPTQSRPDVVTREVTVVVSEEDLVVEAIAKNESSLVRIWQTPAAGGEKSFYGIGIVLSKDGLIAAGKSELLQNSSLEAILYDGTQIVLNQVSSSDNFVFFNAESGSEFKTSILGDSDILQLGQTVILIRGRERNTVSIGRITGLMKAENQEENLSVFSLAETDFVVTEGSGAGPVVNLKGDFVGFNIAGTSNFVPVNVLKNDVKKIN